MPPGGRARPHLPSHCRSLDERPFCAAGRTSFLCGLGVVAFGDLDCVPVDVDDIDGWLTRPDVQQRLMRCAFPADLARRNRDSRAIISSGVTGSPAGRRLVPSRRPGDPCPNMTPFSMTRNAGMTGPYTVPPGVSRTRQWLAAPKRRIRLYDATAPTRLTKRGTSPLVSEVGWTRSAPVRSQDGERPGWAAENSHEIAPLPAGLGGAEGI